MLCLSPVLRAYFKHSSFEAVVFGLLVLSFEAQL